MIANHSLAELVEGGVTFKLLGGGLQDPAALSLVAKELNVVLAYARLRSPYTKQCIPNLTNQQTMLTALCSRCNC